MRSFVRPAARAKFGIAAASTAALVSSPLMALPANALDESFYVLNCNASGPDSFGAAITAANASAGSDFVFILTSNDCTVTIANTVEITESVSIYNTTNYDFTLTHDNSLVGPLVLIDEPGLISPAIAPAAIDTYIRINDIDFDGQDRAATHPQLVLADSALEAMLTLSDTSFSNAESGALAIYDADSQTQIFNSQFTDNDVVTFADMSIGGGGAIHTVGALTLFNSTFSYNDAIGSGGAVYAGSAELKVYESTFTNNSSQLRGGAVSVISGLVPELIESDGYTYYDGYSIRITSSLFSDNTAISGGGVAFEGIVDANPRGTMSNVTFDDNYAVALGGALYVTKSILSISAYTPYYGEGYYRFDAPSSRTLFDDNRAAVYGGAIFTYDSNLATQGNVFDGNSAQAGGAIQQLGGYLNLRDSHFFRNQGTIGGGVRGSNVASLHIVRSSFSQNIASAQGGAVHVEGAEQLAIYENTFYDNVASASSQIFMNVNPNSPSIFAANTVADTIFDNAESSAHILGDSSLYVAANIFASEFGHQFYLGDIQDAGANLYTSYSSAPRSLPSSAEPQDIGYGLVSWEALDLGPMTQYSTAYAPNIYNHVMPLGEDSVAIDRFSLDSSAENAIFMPEEFVPWSFFIDGRGNFRLNPFTGQIFAGDALDVGAFEFGAPDTFIDDEPTPVDPNIVITGVSKPTISATGDSFSVYGRGLDDVTELFIAGVKVSFRVVSANELLVTSGALPLGQAEILAIATDGRAVYQLGVGVVDEPSYWTKNLGNGQAKLYAKNIVGQGKVQFFLNGKEIAWINAIDESDPKLRKANGAAYLVRTVNLTSGKNRLEVKVDGVRVRFTTYSR